MSDCGWLSDRIPVVALGRAEWTADEVEHLSGCRSCQEEWDLVRMTNRLGEGQSALDAAVTTAAVLDRLELARVGRLRARAWSFVGLAAAATIATVIWAERPVVRPPLPPAAAVVAGLQIPLPELDSLQPAELDSVLQTMDEPLLNGTPSEAPELGDLESGELQSVLDFWEG